MKIIISTILAIIFMSGCSHKISLSPSLNELREVKVGNNIDVNVGYYISNEDKKAEVTTPGGGGDKVKYTPYKDIEAALNTMLSRKFSRVYSLNSMNNKNIIETKNIKYIFTTNIHTNSSSSNILIWPPTDFSIDLTCKAVNTNNQKIWEETVSGKGYANSGELMENFSLSAKRATKEAFSKMLIQLEKTNKFNNK